MKKNLLFVPLSIVIAISSNFARNSTQIMPLNDGGNKINGNSQIVVNMPLSCSFDMSREEITLKFDDLPENVEPTIQVWGKYGNEVRDFTTTNFAEGGQTYSFKIGDLPDGYYWVEVSAGKRVGVSHFFKKG